MPRRAEPAGIDEPGVVVLRRAPFSDNPNVGARGQRTRQRILEAALRVFGEIGYHQCSIETIAKFAECSRISFYQYFSSKEDVFRHLAAQVARQLNASTDRLDPITPDSAGWTSLRDWVGRYAEIHEQYQPVFMAFPAAAEDDTSLTADSVRTAGRYLTGLRAHVGGSTLPARTLDAIVDLLRETLGRTLDDLTTLHAAAPDAFDRDDVLDSYTDVVHRSLFGLLPGVNTRGHPSQRPPRVPLGPIMQAALDLDRDMGLEGAASGARAALVAAARRVLVARGFHGTRVDDIVEAAGVSHGAFYRYFKKKDDLAHLVAAQAMRTVSTTFVGIPDLREDNPASRTALRQWLRAYNRAHANETAMIRVWVDAALQDEALRTDSAAVLDWGRHRMVRVLADRGFGDPEIEAIVLLALLDTFGRVERDLRTVNAAVDVIERGFLGR